MTCDRCKHEYCWCCMGVRDGCHDYFCPKWNYSMCANVSISLAVCLFLPVLLILGAIFAPFFYLVDFCSISGDDCLVAIVKVFGCLLGTLISLICSALAIGLCLAPAMLAGYIMITGFFFCLVKNLCGCCVKKTATFTEVNDLDSNL